MIYVLIDPRDMAPFYVGMTCRPGQRWMAHMADRASTPHARLREIRRLGLKCRVRLARMNLSYEDAKASEREVIRQYGATLLNMQWRSEAA